MSLIAEYEDASCNMRHYSEARFKRLTLFLIGEAALLGAKFGNNAGSSEIVLDCLGVLLTFSFWIMTNRAAKYYWDIRKRAIEIEKELGFSQYSGLSVRNKMFNTSMGVHYLYSGSLLMWFILLFISIIS